MKLRIKAVILAVLFSSGFISGCAEADLGVGGLALLSLLEQSADGTYTVSASVTGLTGGTLVVQNNGEDDLSVTEDGVHIFSTKLADAAEYLVEVSSQPTDPHHTCSVADGYGLIDGADISNITINCILGRLMGGAIQNTLTLSAAQVSTAPGEGGLGSLNKARGITTDGTNLYIADTDNHKIVKMVISTGALTTLAGSGTSGSADGTGTAATFNKPKGLTTDGTKLYVADKDNNSIRQIVISTGKVTTLASGFNKPRGVTTDGTNVYVADTDNRKIRQIVIATGAVSTLAGTGAQGSNDGAGATATFDKLEDITTDGTSLFVADKNANKVRKIVIATALVSTLVTGFTEVNGIVTDGTNLYMTSKQDEIKKYDSLNAGGNLTDLVNNGAGYTDGAAAGAQIKDPMGITTDGTALYFCDKGNNVIRKYE